MTRDPNDPSSPPAQTGERAKSLTPQARRALDEAAQRRKDQDAQAAAAPDSPAEFGGRRGPDPVRYGDWEKKGIASDF